MFPKNIYVLGQAYGIAVSLFFVAKSIEKEKTSDDAFALFVDVFRSLCKSKVSPKNLVDIIENMFYTISCGREIDRYHSIISTGK